MRNEDLFTNYEIEITANCNAACPLCARTELGMPLSGNTELSLLDIKRIFQSPKGIKDKTFSLCGSLGDPIVHPECYEICEYLSLNGGQLDLSTNAGYNTAEWWEKLAKLDRMFVHFAVDGHQETNHLYRVNVKWNIVERNMRAYANAGGKGEWVYLVFGHNEHEVDAARSLATELGFSFSTKNSGRNVLAAQEKRTYALPSKKNNTVVTIEQPLNSNFKHQSDITPIKKIENAIHENRSPKIDFLKEKVKTISCRHLNTKQLYIASNGTLWPCCWIRTDEDIFTFAQPRHAFRGNPETINQTWNNLHYNSIEEILSHKRFKTLVDRWQPDHQEWITTCLKTCGEHGARLDKVINTEKN